MPLPSVRPAILYRGGPHNDEHNRTAICAIIWSALPSHLTMTQIAKAAATCWKGHFMRKFNKYENKEGGWKCTEGTAAHRIGKQYELMLM
jgi:hypothetical protein